jgi:hypothetical protein
MAGMSDLRLPLWFLYDRQPNVAPLHPPCGGICETLAFSSAKKLIEFLDARQGGNWRLEMANDGQGVLSMAAALRARNEGRVCLNPEPDGSAGETVALAELLEFSERLRKQ